MDAVLPYVVKIDPPEGRLISVVWRVWCVGCVGDC